MKAKRLDFKARLVRALEVDFALILFWLLFVVLSPDSGTMLVVIFIGGLLSGIIMFHRFENNIIGGIFFFSAIISIPFFCLNGYLWYEKFLGSLVNVIEFARISGIISICLSGIVALGIFVDLICRIFILRWNKKVNKQLLSNLPS